MAQGRNSLRALLRAIDEGKVIVLNGGDASSRVLLEITREFTPAELYDCKASMLLDQDDIAELRAMLDEK